MRGLRKLPEKGKGGGGEKKEGRRAGEKVYAPWLTT